MSNPQPSRRDLMDAIIDRARREPDLRAALFRDPKPAIYQHFGVEIPQDFNIRFIERHGSRDLMAVFPQPPQEQEEDELSLDELEEAAGGTGDPPPDPESPW